MNVIPANSSASTGYSLTRSLRTRASASANLSQTLTTSATWALSVWVKRGVLSAISPLFGDGVKFLANDTLTAGSLTTTAVYRDPSNWYHVYVSNLGLYINGALIGAVTTSALTNPKIASNGTNYFDGELAEFNFINGATPAVTAFGLFDSLTGVWKHAKYTGSYPTGSSYLPFTDNSALTTSSNVGLGKDFSGNGNYWTTNNISITAGTTYDSMLDVPTLTSATAANFAVLNPLFNSSVTVSAGNLNAAVPGAGYQNSVSTIAFPTSGKFYFEVTIVSNGGSGNNQQMGITALPLGVYNFGLDCFATSGTSARKVNNNTVGADLYGPVSNGTIFGVAVDATNGKAYIAVNNTYIDSSSPTGGTGGYSMTSGQQYFAYFNGYSSGVNAYNFGQRPFTYTPPTNFVALNTYNLPTSTIVKGNTVMDATLYTGTLLSNAITNAAAFKPDLVWIKSRSAATDHKWTDSVRGVTKALASNSTNAETTDVQGLTAFNTNGFTVGTNTDYNNLAATYVAWQWQAGQGSTSSNTNGSITSTVSVNASAGFSVVTYTGTGANATVGHGLGVAPSFIIVKNRSSALAWPVYTSYYGKDAVLQLESTSGGIAAANYWGTANPTSSVFGVGTASQLNGSGNSLVAYCWTPIAGYSAFGSVSTNGAADNAFVYTGFLPRFVLLKRTDSTSNWYIWDTARNTFNVFGNELYPNLSNAEASATDLDILSNGFKLRSASFSGTWIYAAFATNPFKNSLAF